MKKAMNNTVSKSLVMALSAGFILSLGLSAKADLKSDMDQVAKLFVTISKQSQDSSKDASSAVLAGQLIPLFTDSMNIVPPSITAMPIDQQAAAIATYKKLMQQEIDDATALQTAFTNNDAAKISSLLQDMGAVRNDGHSQFNPQ